MFSGSLLGLLMQIIPAFSNETGVDIIVVDPNYNKLEVVSYVEEEVCAYSRNPDCKLVNESLPFASFVGFSSNQIQTNADDINRNICVLQPASSQLAADTNLRVAINKILNGESAVEGDPQILTNKENSAFHLNLIHLAGCTLDLENIDYAAQLERANAFATMGTAFALGDTTFVREPTKGEHRKYSSISTSEASSYASDIAERVLMDLWKAEAVDYLKNNNYCGPRGKISISSSSEINVKSIGRAFSWVPNCPSDEGQKGSSMTQERSISVTDSNLHLYMFGAPEELIRRNRGEGGNMGPSQPVTPNPPYQYEPFKAFNNFDEAISYMWTNASNMVGIR